MGWCRAVALGTPLLLALLASQLVVRQGTYRGAPFTSVPVWPAPPAQGDGGRALHDVLRRAIDHGTPVIVRGGVNHWPAVESACCCPADTTAIPHAGWLKPTPASPASGSVRD
jgi:hypothetical protein